MSVLLDTNALIWLLLDIHRLGPETRQLADSALIDSELLVSAFSFWEVSMLMQKNRMDIEQDMSE